MENTEYEIITIERDANGNETGQWTNDGLGEPNRFPTKFEARLAIENLRSTGDEWADATYDVREITADA